MTEKDPFAFEPPTGIRTIRAEDIEMTLSDRRGDKSRPMHDITEDTLIVGDVDGRSFFLQKNANLWVDGSFRNGSILNMLDTNQAPDKPHKPPSELHVKNNIEGARSIEHMRNIVVGGDIIFTHSRKGDWYGGRISAVHGDILVRGNVTGTVPDTDRLLAPQRNNPVILEEFAHFRLNQLHAKGKIRIDGTASNIHLDVGGFLDEPGHIHTGAQENWVISSKDASTREPLTERTIFILEHAPPDAPSFTSRIAAKERVIRIPPQPVAVSMPATPPAPPRPQRREEHELAKIRLGKWHRADNKGAPQIVGIFRDSSDAIAASRIIFDAIGRQSSGVANSQDLFPFEPGRRGVIRLNPLAYDPVSRLFTDNDITVTENHEYDIKTQTGPAQRGATTRRDGFGSGGSLRR